MTRPFRRRVLYIPGYDPRDFDVSPYFRIVKPRLEQGFDFHDLDWDEPPAR